MRRTSVWLKDGRKATTPALHAWMEMGVAAKSSSLLALISLFG